MSTRAERRGKINKVWNNTLKVLQTYRLSTRGVWIMVNNNSAPHLTKHEMNKLINQ